MIEKSNTQRVMDFFFKNPTREVYLRELSREMKLSMPAIVFAIKNLKREGLVFVNKTKALTKVKANIENKEFIRLKRLSNLESLYASELVDYLLKELRPLAIICFGSYSRGEDFEKSDVDIAIIKGSQKNLEFEKFEKKIGRKISVHFIDLNKTSEEFKNNIHNGIVLDGAL